MAGEEPNNELTPEDVERLLGDEPPVAAHPSVETEAIPFETRAERNPNKPADEPEFGVGYKPTSVEMRMAFEMLCIEGMTIKRAARALEVGDKTFRAKFSRQISEAAQVRSNMDPGTNFIPSLRQRFEVSAYLAASLSSAQICGVMFRGKMTESRFKDLFANEVQLGTAAMKGLAMKTIGRVMIEGSDRDALSAAKWTANAKDIGGHRTTTRYDHASADPNAAGASTKDEQTAVVKEIVDDLVNNRNVEPAVAEFIAAALVSQGTGATRN